MAVTRLDSDERRKAIVAAAVPLFARKGFAGTTTRELAEAAGISEALLFRHFPEQAAALPRDPAARLRRRPGARTARQPAALDRDAGLHGALHGATVSARQRDRAGRDSSCGCGWCCTAFSKTASTPASCSRRFPTGSSRCSRPRSKRRPRRATFRRVASPRRQPVLVCPACRGDAGFCHIAGAELHARTRARSTSWSRRRAPSSCGALA